MNFEHPWILTALAPLAFLSWLGWKRCLPAERRRWPLLMLSLVFLILALGNPYWSYTQARRGVQGAELVVLLDVSQSMFCMEHGSRRIDRARDFLRTLLAGQGANPVSVIYFSGDAFLGCPSTSDLQAVQLFLDSAVPGMTATAGTRSSTLGKILDQTRAEGEAGRKRVGLLFSDGEFSDDVSELQRWLSRQTGFTLFAFLSGTENSPVPEFDLSRPHPGAVSRPNPETLQQLARAGRGTMYDLTGKRPLAELNAAMSGEIREIMARGELIPEYRFFPFLAAAFLLVLAYLYLPLFLRTGLPVVLILVSLASMALKGPDEKINLFRKAVTDMRAERYEEALEKMQMIQAESPTAETDTAIGNIHFLQKNYDEAISNYRAALNRNPRYEPARWNWEVALKRKSQPDSPPQENEEPSSGPQDLPPPSRALLNYFNQLEKEQMQQNNRYEQTPEFAW